MNRFIGLIIMVVAIAALAGAAIGWRFPFLGRSRSANQLQTAQQNTNVQPANRTSVQPANRTRVQRASQPTAQAPSNAQTTAQAPDATVNPAATNVESAQTENQPVPALW